MLFFILFEGMEKSILHDYANGILSSYTIFVFIAFATASDLE